MSRIANCHACDGTWACLGCGALLRKQLAQDTSVPHVWGTGEVRAYLQAVRDRAPYTHTFPIGPRGGALLDLGDGNGLEVFLPYEVPKTGELLEYMPMELDGSIVHDPGKGKPATPWQIEACVAGTCRCANRPRGWILTRPLVRGLLGVTDAFLAEHCRDLPGVQPCWCLCVSTPVFMTEVVFNVEFRFPTRRAARAARAARETTRRCAPPRPTGRWSSRPRRKK